MKVTFLLPHARNHGGIRVIRIHAENLMERGHEVTLISTPRRPGPARSRIAGAVKRLISSNGADSNAEMSALDGSPVPHRQIDQWRPIADADVPDADVVVATWWETAPWVASLSPEKGAKAYFAQDYGAHAGQPLDAVAATWRLPLHKITISQWMLKLIQKHCDDQSISVVPNAVDLQQFNQPQRDRNERFTVGLAYSARQQKGMDIAIGAIELARERIPDLQVVAFGPYPPTDSLSLPDDTQFHLRADEHELAGIYGACDAWLFTSRIEGFGLPILEAMACRTPVIATPAGAAPELLGGGGGALVPLDDPAGMAEAIVRFAAMPPEQWRAMSEQARRIVEGYTWKDAAARFEDALRVAIQRGQRTVDREQRPKESDVLRPPSSGLWSPSSERAADP